MNKISFEEALYKWTHYYESLYEAGDEPLKYSEYCQIYYDLDPIKAEQYYRSCFQGLASV